LRRGKEKALPKGDGRAEKDFNFNLGLSILSFTNCSNASKNKASNLEMELQIPLYKRV